MPQYTLDLPSGQQLAFDSEKELSNEQLVEVLRSYAKSTGVQYLETPPKQSTWDKVKGVAQSARESLSPILGPTESQMLNESVQMADGTTQYKPAGGLVEQRGMMGAMFSSPAEEQLDKYKSEHASTYPQAVKNWAIDTAKPFLSPGAVLAPGLVAANPRLMAALFAGTMIPQAVSQGKEAIEAETGPKRLEAGLHAGTAAVLGGLAAKHAATRPPPELPVTYPNNWTVEQRINQSRQIPAQTERSAPQSGVPALPGGQRALPAPMKLLVEPQTGQQYLVPIVTQPPPPPHAVPKPPSVEPIRPVLSTTELAANAARSMQAAKAAGVDIKPYSDRLDALLAKGDAEGIRSLSGEVHEAIKVAAKSEPLPSVVTVAGADFEVVSRNADGTLKLKNSQGDTFDTAPGEKFTAKHSQTPHNLAPKLDTLKTSRAQFVKEEIDRLSGARKLAVIEAEHAIRKAWKPTKPLPPGTNKVQAFQVKGRYTPEERKLLTQLNVAKQNSVADIRVEAETAGKVWDAIHAQQVAAKNPPKPEVGKQPWEMTKAEYVKQQMDAKAWEKAPKSKKVAVSDGTTEGARPMWFELSHGHAVARALREGKPVPPEVLKDYPDLAKSAKGTPISDKPATGTGLGKVQDTTTPVPSPMGTPKKGALAKPTPPPDVKPTATKKGVVDKAEQWADDVINKRASANPMLDPELMAAVVTKTAALIVKAGMTFARWSADMVKRYGPDISDKLGDIWSRAMAHAKSAYGQTAGRLFDYYSVDYATRLKGVNKPFSGEAGKMAEKAQIQKHQLIGDLSEWVDPAKRAAGKMNKATKWLNQHTRLEGEQGYYTNYQRTELNPAALRGVSQTTGAPGMIPSGRGVQGVPVPDYVRETLNTIEAANMQIGRMASRVNPDFAAWGGIQRIAKPVLVDAIKLGEGGLYRQIVNALANDNGMTVKQVEQWAADMRRQLNDPLQGDESIRKINQEFRRAFPRFPSAVRYGGRLIEILEAKPFDYISKAAENTAGRVAFVESFPDAVLQRVRQGVYEEGPLAANMLENFVKSMHGLPADRPMHDVMSPASFVGMNIGRPIGRVQSDVFQPLSLTAAGLNNAIEVVFGNTPMMFGYRNYLRGLATQAEKTQNLEAMGKINLNIYNWSRSSMQVSDAGRIFSQSMRVGTANNYLNELQERLAAATAEATYDHLKKHGTPYQRARQAELARVFGLTEGEAQGIRDGTAGYETYEKMMMLAARRLTSGNMLASDRSGFANNRIWSKAIPFQAYMMMKFRLFRDLVGNFADAVESGKTERIQHAGTLLARFLAGTTAQGVTQKIVIAGLVGGLLGIEIASNEAKDDPFSFLTEVFLIGQGGPPSTIYSMFKEGGQSTVDLRTINVVDKTYPGGKLQDIFDMMNGRGRYKDLSTQDRLTKYFTNLTPAYKIVDATLATVGIADGDPGLNAATAAYHRWVRKEYGVTEVNQKLLEDKRVELRTALKKIASNIKEGKPYGPELSKALREAIVLKSKDPMTMISGADPMDAGARSVADGLRARKILLNPEGGFNSPMTPQQQAALRKRIGDRAYNKLLAYDNQLEAIALVVGQ